MKYNTITDYTTQKLLIKGNRFIGQCFPLNSREEAVEILKSVRKKNYDANHNCYAWKFIDEQGESFKYSDDGEPSGTAGKPIYDVFSKFDVTNLIMIVTRYFGGTKLGTGGLVRAYSGCAGETLSLATIQKVHLGTWIQFNCSYEEQPLILREIKSFSPLHLEQEFLENIHIQTEIDSESVTSLIEKIKNISNGRVLGQIQIHN